MSLHPIVLQKPPSPEQLPAVETVDCDVVLTAGAGSGKTRTLVARILHLLSLGVPTRTIVAVTFTVKAAREMRNRLREEITDYLATPGLGEVEYTRWTDIYAELDAARIGTIHSLCGEILRAHPAEADVDPAFAVLEEAVSTQLRAESIAETLGWAAEDADAATLFAHFSADTLQSILDTLLNDCLKAQLLFAARLWEGWPHLGATALKAALTDETLSAAADTILAWDEDGTLAAALAAGDTLAPVLSDFPVAWNELQRCLALGDLTGAFACAPRLRAATPLNRGRAACWSGQDFKHVLRSFRDAYETCVKPLVDGVDPALDSVLAAILPQLERLFADALARYHQRKDERHALDFDDLEQKALDLLAQNVEVRERWQEEAQALLVDEFQDTNGRQRDLVQHLNAGRGRLFIVGDAEQSIYRFRGAEVEVFRQERAEIARFGRVCTMNTSFRTHARLVDTLNELLAQIMGETAGDDEPWREPFAPLTANRVDDALALPGPYVEFHLAAGSKGDGALERAAAALAVRLRNLMAAAGERLAYGDIAVLCRSYRGFSAYEDAFEAAGIPYETVAGRGFLDRPEVRDLLNALQAFTDPTDDLALYGLLRSPAIGFSDSALQRLLLAEDGDGHGLWQALRTDDQTKSRRAVALIQELNRLAGRVTVADLLKYFVDATGYRAILLAADDARATRNVGKLLLDAQHSGIVSAGAFLEYVKGLRAAGSREGEARTDSNGAVQIMTVHQAKGLEFPVVAVGDAGGGGGAVGNLLLDGEIGVIPAIDGEDGTSLVWKLAKAHELSKQSAESDRLLYVAATRARERLLVSGHVTVSKDGKLGPRNWLGQLCAAVGLERVPADYDPGSLEPLALSLETGNSDNNSVGGALYSPAFTVDLEAEHITRVEPVAATVIPRLLAPLETPLGDELASTPDRVWRVVPRRAQRWAPRWLIGKLVHAAIALWRFPDDREFDAWCQAQIRGYGLLDAARTSDAVQRTRRLLNNLRRHPLHAEIEATEARYHEIPYATGQNENGRLDLLFRSQGDAGTSAWTLVDFKSDRLMDERARAQLLAESDYPAQIERYVAAVAELLGVRPRALLCLLDDRGACSVIPIGDETLAIHGAGDDNSAWSLAFELSEPVCAPLLESCRDAGLSAPEIGQDIVDGRGRVVATAELAWIERRLAVFLPGQETDLLLAGQAGWHTFLADDTGRCARDLIATWNLENTE